MTTEKLPAAITKPLLSWYRANARVLPWRDITDPYRIWVSEIMLQQTRVAAVLGYYARFLEAFPTVEALAAADEEQLMKRWEGLGYYSRARNLQKAAKMIMEECGGTSGTAGHRRLYRQRHCRRGLWTTGSSSGRQRAAGSDPPDGLP